MARIRDDHGVALAELDLGGGHPVPYLDGDRRWDLAHLARDVRHAIREQCLLTGLPVPHVIIEPGRAVVASAGVTMYRMLTVKHTPGGRTFVAVDGGMSDNPRPALYAARYTVRCLRRPAAGHDQRPATVVGRFCEARDVTARDAPLPSDITRATCWPSQPPAPTTTPWRPPTTMSAALPWLPSVAARPGS